MTVKQGNTGSLVFYCHSRCGADGGRMIDVFNAGVMAEPADEVTRRARRNGAGSEKSLGKFVRYHDWTEYDGTPIVRHLKYETGWLWKTPMGFGLGRRLDEMPLYGGVMLRMALGANSHKNRPILWCEGEKDAEAAIDAAWPVIATCDAGIPPADLSVLRGRHVIVVPDRDDKGELRAQRIIEALNGIATTEIRRPKVDSAKADLADHIEAGFGFDDLALDREAFYRRVAARVAEEYDVPEIDAPRLHDVVQRTVLGDAARTAMRTIALEDALAARGLPVPEWGDTIEADETVDWLVDGLVHRSGGTMIVAQAKAGKTTLALNLAHAALTGDEFLGNWKTHPLDDDECVLWIDTEMGKTLHTWRKRVMGEAENRMLVWSVRGHTSLMDPREQSGRDYMTEVLNGAAKGRRFGMMVVDVLGVWAASLGLDENSATDMRAMVEGIVTLATELKCPSVVVLHHMGHSGKRARGSSALQDWTHSTLMLTRSEEERIKEDEGMFADPEDAEDQIRTLSAVGREVNLPDTPLMFEAETFKVRIAENDEVKTKRKSPQERRELRDESRLQDVLRNLLNGPLSQTMLLKRVPSITDRRQRERVIKLGQDRGFLVAHEVDGVTTIKITDAGRIDYTGRYSEMASQLV
jgi:5S rRNA maturation endonuclease (ribonuclease M5)